MPFMTWSRESRPACEAYAHPELLRYEAEFGADEPHENELTRADVQGYARNRHVVYEAESDIVVIPHGQQNVGVSLGILDLHIQHTHSEWWLGEIHSPPGVQGAKAWSTIRS